MENNKNKFGLEKWSFSCLPMKVLKEIAKIFKNGEEKYGRWNYLEKGSSQRIYFDACMRHLDKWIDPLQSNYDKDSGLHHLDHAITNLMIMRHAELEDVLEKDLTETSVKPIPSTGKDTTLREIETAKSVYSKKTCR